MEKNLEKAIQMIMSPSELMYRSEQFHKNLKYLSTFLGSRRRMIVKSKDELLFFGRVDSTCMRKLDDWPEDLTMIPTDDKPLLKDVLESIMGSNVKIGARDGVGFIYCGKCKPALLDWLDFQSDKVKWGNISKLDKIKADAFNFEGDEHTREDLEKKLKRYEKKVANFKGTLSCEVTDIRRSLLPEEEGAYIILFDGCVPAAGSMWTIDECTIRL